MFTISTKLVNIKWVFFYLNYNFIGNPNLGKDADQINVDIYKPET